METYKPSFIPVDFFEIKSIENIVPIEGIIIPKIKIDLIPKKGIVRSDSPIVKIRGELNKLTNNNLKEIIENIKIIVMTKCQDINILKDVTEELFQNFLLNEKNIRSYIDILKSIQHVAIRLNEGKNSESIKVLFTQKCKENIFIFIEYSNIYELSMLDHDNEDDYDIYCKKKENISNLLTTICYLYDERKNSDKNTIHLTLAQIFPLTVKLIDKYNQNVLVLNSKSTDDEDYIIYYRISILYAEFIFIILKLQGSNMINDEMKAKVNVNIVDFIQNNKNSIEKSLKDSFLKKKFSELSL